MHYADFMAFPFPQHELMTKQGKLEVDPNIVLDFCHVTSVPPYQRTMDKITDDHQWFAQRMAMQSHRMRVVYGLQNPPDDVLRSDLFLLRKMGISIMTIAYQDVNKYGGGFAVPKAPLTERGKKLLDNMDEACMILDLSHAGHQTARDALEYMEQKRLSLPVIASHTACFTKYAHNRNLPDDVLLGIKNQSGLVGLVTLSWLLHESDNGIGPFVDHLAHLVEVMGEDQVCLGTDGVYQRMNQVDERARFDMMKARIDPQNVFKARYPEQAAELNCPERIRVIKQRLLALNWPVARIEKIVGANMFRFFQ